VLREVPGPDILPRTSGAAGKQGAVVGLRAAELDAKTALIELRAWIAEERATW
jgi:hypothetical protein